ncbi:hypothetical protein [Deefgea rivuli]|nr:hypothetical protein [Deefgea rivuli]
MGGRVVGLGLVIAFLLVKAPAGAAVALFARLGLCVAWFAWH